MAKMGIERRMQPSVSIGTESFTGMSAPMTKPIREWLSVLRYPIAPQVLLRMP